MAASVVDLAFDGDKRVACGLGPLGFFSSLFLEAPEFRTLRLTLQTLAATSLLLWRAGSLRSFTAIRKKARLVCGSFSRKGEMFAYGGRDKNLKDRKDLILEFRRGAGCEILHWYLASKKIHTPRTLP
jgi:hypothetical protein